MPETPTQIDFDDYAGDIAEIVGNGYVRHVTEAAIIGDATIEGVYGWRGQMVSHMTERFQDEGRPIPPPIIFWHALDMCELSLNEELADGPV